MLKDNLKPGKLHASEIDVVIGHNLRLIRLNKGFNQAGLAEQLGISFQQIQKYEKGINKVAASVLYQCAKFFDVPLSDFFIDIEEDHKEPNSMQQSKKEIELTALFRKIENPIVKKKILDLLDSMGKS